MKKLFYTVLISLTSLSLTAQVALPNSQDFEGPTFPPTDWQTFPIGSLINWVRNTAVSGYGIGSACTSFDNYNNSTGYYGIRLPSMDFSSVTDPYIRYDIAYAQRTTPGSDVFGLWWSPNGSTGWLNLHNYSGAALATAPATTSLFIPAANEWHTVTYSLASLIGKPYVRLAIEDDCAHGNMIYFDNVTVFDSVAAGINETIYSNDFFTYPNPVNDQLTIQINSPITHAVSFTLYTIEGKKIFSKILKDQAGHINLSDYASGIYLYQITVDDKPLKTGKITKQ